MGGGRGEGFGGVADGTVMKIAGRIMSLVVFQPLSCLFSHYSKKSEGIFSLPLIKKHTQAINEFISLCNLL